VLRGLGMAMVGEYVVEADLKAGRLVRVLDGYTLPERVLHVLY
jgi:DNA-binding transcriptional LysR family regulator